MYSQSTHGRTAGATPKAWLTITVACLVLVSIAAAGATAASTTEEELATIHGEVTFEDGTPAADVLVDAMGEESEGFDFTDEDGLYSIEVEPGTYDVQAFDEASGAVSDAHEVTVEAGDTVELDLTLVSDNGGEETPPPEEGAATIEGVVTNEDGDPVGGAHVQADDGELFFTDETDSDGSYSLSVEPGTYEVTAFDEATEAFSDVVEVTVEDGETVTQDIQLETFDDGGFDESEYVADMSVEHIGGTEPDEMPELDAMDVADGQIAIDLVDFSQEMWMQELGDLGVDETTEFEITVEFTDFEPRAVVASAADMDVSFEGSTMTVTAKPLDPQWIDGEPMFDDWPEGDDDQADFGFDAMLSMTVLNLDFPEDEFDPTDHPMTGVTIATDAQAFSMPQYVPGEGDEPDALEIIIAGPHLTTDGEENEGLYQAFLPDSLLDEWGVDGPDDLDAAYKGEQTDFSATETSGGILIEIDVSYSAGTVGISPSETADPQTPTPINGDEPTPTNGDDETPTPEDGPGATPTPEDSDSIPGPGIVGTVAALLGLGYLLRRRGIDR